VAPKHNGFPGAVNTTATNFAYVQRDFSFTAKGFTEYHHTGLYAVPGQKITVEVTSALPNSSWTVYIGFHFDNDYDHSSWVRWPTVYTYR